MVRNFLFHRVSPVRDRLWDPMDVVLFEKCIKHISNKYEVVLFENLAFTEGLQAKHKYATIMFDDGYKDNIEYAAPILAKYNCKASFYVVTDSIDNNLPTWTHILEYLFQHTNQSTINIDFEFVPSFLRVKSLQNVDERVDYVRKLKPLLKSLSHADRRKILERVAQSYSDVLLPKLMMDWNDLRELRKAGHYIGSHTITHCMLGTMTDEEEIKHELLQSGNRIKEELGYFPLTISYPVGSYNEVTKRIAKETGYKIGLAVRQNIFNPKEGDLFEVSRIELYNEPWWKTKLRISNALEGIKTLIGYK